MASSTASSNTSTKTSIILNGQDDWDEWIEVVKTAAISGDVWDYINPDTLKGNVPAFTEPNEPAYQDVASASDKRLEIKYSTLTEDEKEEFKRLQQRYKRNYEAYIRKKAALATIRTKIQESVSRPNLAYTFNCDSSYDMLAKLKERFSPTTTSRTREVLSRYRRLLRAPRDQAVDIWLQDVEKVYNDCKKLEMLETKGTRAIQDFLDAISSLAPEFAGYQANKLLEEENIDFYHVVQKFREFIQGTATQRRPQNGAFAAAFQGKTPRTCVCGIKHLFKDCYYLNKSKRPDNWKPSFKIQKQIEEKIENNSRLREAIERYCEDPPNKRTNTKGSDSKTNSNSKTKSIKDNDNEDNDGNDDSSIFVTAALASTSYALRNSFILDSRATNHVCNDENRFTSIRKAQGERLFAGNTIVPVQGIGDITITVNTPDGPKEITLKDTAFIPSFHTSVVALRKFNKKGVYQDQSNNTLIRNKQIYCYIQERHKQWVLEYNLLDSAFQAYSAKP